MSPKVNAVVNAHAILKFLSEQSDPKGVTQIAKDTGVSASSTFNILKTLVDLRMVVFRAEDKSYDLGPGIFELAQNGISNSQILTTAQPILSDLAERYKCQSGLWEIINGNRTVIAMGEAATPARLNIRIGQNFPIGAGSAGRAFMARHANDFERLARAFSEVTWQGSITLEQYVSEVKKVVRNGYAIDKDILYPGVTTISSAFFEPETKREFCLSVFLLSPALNAKTIRAIAEEVRSSASHLAHSARLAVVA